MSDNLTKEQKRELGVLNYSKLSSKGRKGEVNKIWVSRALLGMLR